MKWEEIIYASEEDEALPRTLKKATNSANDLSDILMDMEE